MSNFFKYGSNALEDAEKCFQKTLEAFERVNFPEMIQEGTAFKNEVTESILFNLFFLLF